MPKCAVWDSGTLWGDGPVTGRLVDGTSTSTIAVDRRTLGAVVSFKIARDHHKCTVTIDPLLRHLIPRDSGHDPLPLRRPLNLTGRLDLAARVVHDVVAEIRRLVRDRPTQVLDYAACVLRNRRDVCDTLRTITGEDAEDSPWEDGEDEEEEKEPTPAECALAYTEWVHWLACSAIHHARIASTHTRLSAFPPID